MATEPIPTVTDLVHQVTTGSVESMISTRYPGTYARDFFRAHLAQFGAQQDDEAFISRAEAGPRIREYAERTGQDYPQVLIALAEGYLTYHHYHVTTQEKSDALLDDIQQYWKSYGYTEAPDLGEAGLRAMNLLIAHSEARRRTLDRVELADLAAQVASGAIAD